MCVKVLSGMCTLNLKAYTEERKKFHWLESEFASECQLGAFDVN